MSWIPRDISTLCQSNPHVQLTTCGTQVVLFLQLVLQYLSRSRDDDYLTTNFHTTTPTDFDDFIYRQLGDESDAERLERFDFIVIGAGSAGCVVANRLSEISNWKILLLEAGPEEPKIAEVPAITPAVLQSSIDWNYRTQPQPHSCRSRPGGGCPWARGKVMGGSSSINYLIYTRGNPSDYDEWEQLGNPGWSYEDVLPYFKKLEHNGDPDIAADRKHHGTHGYQSVERFPYQDENVNAILEAWKEVGLPELDQNAGEQLGVMLLQTTSKEGRRQSTNSAYMRPVRYTRDNLVVRTNSHVSRILIESSHKHPRAIGVEYVYKGAVKYAIAKREVILSAGSINSPVILMSSGIGPYEQLQRLNIPVVKDLPVGYNLQDHATLDGIVFALNNDSTRNLADFPRDLKYYLHTQRGPLSSTGPLQVNVFLKTEYAVDHRPDIQYSFDAVDVNNFYADPVLAAQTNVFPLSYYSGFMVRPVLLHPRSRGSVSLNESDPIFGDPIIQANTFTQEPDLRIIVAAIRNVQHLLDTHAMAHLGARLVTTPLPACEQLPFDSDLYWECVASEYTTTIYHPVGTCPMGPHSNPAAVVDHLLRVHGVRRLRVIDASIMPNIIRGNTNVPTIMIAERASDLIKHAWKQYHQ